jgi:AraC-like DNA-binding protein
MSGLIAALRLLAASQVLLFGGALLVAAGMVRLRAAGVALAAAVICYLMLPLIEPWLGVAMGLPAFIASAIPPILLWFTWEVFEDRRRLPRGGVAAAVVYLVMLLLTWPVSGSGGPAAVVLPLVQLFKLGFVVAAVVLVWRGRQADLIEQRLRLRRVFATGMAVLVAAVVVTELVTAGQVPAVVELVGMAGIFCLALALNLAQPALSPVLLKTTSASGSPAPVPSKDPLLDELLRLMTEERRYADHDLRIGTLAANLGVPEYRLRRTINAQLGHRNFNQFVNGYRIDEAARRLREGGELPILSIALDVGFRSMSSFSAAFRDRYGVPPSAYRSDEAAKS